MHILVTGGAGFIGSHFIHYLLTKRNDITITNIDLMTYAGNLENIQRIRPGSNYRFIRGDIGDKLTLREAFRQEVDVLVNFAAESHVDRSIEDPEIFLKTNALGTQNLLEFARNGRVKQFIQISTDEVYGSLEGSGLFLETTPLAPNSPYSASKAAADLMVQAYFRTYGLPVNITRCSNNYGPYQHPEKLIPLMTIRALRNERLPVYGDGLNVRDWLYVEDHCRAIELVMEKGRPGEVYNIGGNHERTNMDIVRSILRMLDKPESLIEHVEDRKGHDRRYGIDASKIRQELGWSPTHDVTEGLEKTVRWYVDNERWWSAAI